MSGSSRTAEYMALFRALETARAPSVRLFSDPWAKSFLSPKLRLAAAAASLPPLHSAICAFIDWRWPGARSSGVARTRYIDEALRRGVRDGLCQIVILGAGFDSRAYRIPALAATRVFEVDQPETSLAKQRCLRKSLGRLPAHVAYVAFDFNRASPAEVMGDAGFDAGRPTFFLWEGVTNYLTERAVDATLRYVASAPAGSRILFTYIHRDVLRGGPAFAADRRARSLVSNVGEPWTFGFEPAELPGYLRARGLHLLCDVDSIAYRACYMGAEGRHLRGYEFYRIAVAEVSGRAGTSLGNPQTCAIPKEHHAESQ